MKDIAVKSLVIIPLIAFVDYFIMILVGCSSCVFRFSNNFYECTFCKIGKVVLLLSVLAYTLILFFEIRMFFRNKKAIVE